MSHADTLDQTERLGTSFFGSLAFHGLLVAIALFAGWVENRNRISLGDPNGGRLGAVAVTPVSTIPLPSHAGPKNPVAVDTKSMLPTPVTKAKPAPKVTAPDPKAIPIPSRNAKLLRPSEASSQPNKFRAQQHDAPNQLYSDVGTRLSSPDYGLRGGGGIGVGTNSPFGNMFGAYADILRDRVAQHWQSASINASNAPVAGVTFVLHRDGSVTDIRITQPSGNSALDFSARRAVMDAAPFPPLPQQFPKNDAEIEFLFQLKR
jgi:protein TonB